MKSEHTLSVYPYREMFYTLLISIPCAVLLTWMNISKMLDGQNIFIPSLLMNVHILIVIFGSVWTAMKRFDFSENGIEIHTLFNTSTVFHAWTDFSYVYFHTHYKGRPSIILSGKPFNARRFRFLYECFSIAPTHLHGAIVIERVITRRNIDLIMSVIPESIQRIDVPKLI